MTARSEVGCGAKATVRLDAFAPEGRGCGPLVYVFFTCYGCAERVVATYAPHLVVDWSAPTAPRECGHVTSYTAGT